MCGRSGSVPSRSHCPAGVETTRRRLCDQHVYGACRRTRLVATMAARLGVAYPRGFAGPAAAEASSFAKATADEMAGKRGWRNTKGTSGGLGQTGRSTAASGALATSGRRRTGRSPYDRRGGRGRGPALRRVHRIMIDQISDSDIVGGLTLAAFFDNEGEGAPLPVGVMERPQKK